MRVLSFAFVVVAVAVFGQASADGDETNGASPRLAAARNIVAAVNAKDADKYVRDLAADVVVQMYDGEVRLRGKEAVRANRASYFQQFAHTRNELRYLVEIDQRVVMHDQVWLTEESQEPADIVEVFTFESGKIVRIDVIQPASLFAGRAERP